MLIFLHKMTSPCKALLSCVATQFEMGKQGFEMAAQVVRQTTVYGRNSFLTCRNFDFLQTAVI